MYLWQQVRIKQNENGKSILYYKELTQEDIDRKKYNMIFLKELKKRR